MESDDLTEQAEGSTKLQAELLKSMVVHMGNIERW